MKFVSPLLLIIIFVLPTVAFAQVGSTPFIVCDGAFPDACEFSDVIQLIRNIINYLVVFSTVLASISFAWAGFLYLSSQGNTSQMDKAKGIFTKVAIGFAIVLSAWLIVDTLMRALLNDPFIFGA